MTGDGYQPNSRFFLIIGITKGTSEFGWISLGKSGYHLFLFSHKNKLEKVSHGQNWEQLEKQTKID